MSTNVMDGIVAGLSFLTLAMLGDFGTTSLASLPRSSAPTLSVVFAVAELIVVVAVVMVVMLYEPDRPYRTNFLLLAAGLLTMAAADRLVAYFHTVDVPTGARWAGIRLILGPLLIAFAMLEHPQPRPTTVNDASRGLDWTQLILPYVGFVGIANLVAFHVWIGRPITRWFPP